MEKRKAGRPSKSNLRKLEILQKASSIFVIKGYEDTTLDEIGDSLGFNKAALYYYFKNKEDLFIQVLNHERERLWEIARVETDEIEGVEDKIIKYFDVRSELAYVQIKLNELTNSNLIELDLYHLKSDANFREKENDYLLGILSHINSDHTIEEKTNFISTLINVQYSILMSTILLRDLENNITILTKLKSDKEKVLKYLLNSFYTNRQIK